MIRRSGRNPRPKKFTPEQEMIMSEVEKDLAYSTILQRGVARVLEQEYDYHNIDACIRALQDARRIQTNAYEKRNKVL